MDRFLYIAAGIAGFITAAMGAYGVHGLKPRISPELYGMFETAVRYQMFHALAMFAAAWGWVRWRHRAFGAAGVLFILSSPSMTGQMIALDGGEHLGWQQSVKGFKPSE